MRCKRSFGIIDEAPITLGLRNMCKSIVQNIYMNWGLDIDRALRLAGFASRITANADSVTARNGPA